MTTEPCPGYYSIIQYCPDPSRMEVCNVGVLLYVPRQYLEVKFQKHNLRCVRFFGDAVDGEWINQAKESLATRLAGDKKYFLAGQLRLELFIATRVNKVQLTPLRPCKVEDSAAELERLFVELVE